jgi:DNA-binding IclR family transcriptional regulator
MKRAVMTDAWDQEDTVDDRRAAYSAPALEKGLDILELLAGSDQAMTTGQIAEGLGRSKNEIFRMVFVLEQRNYLVRDPATDLLRLSNRLFQMGLRTPRTRQLTEVAIPAMEALSETIGHSSHLVVVNRGETVVIATAAGGADVGFALRLGYRRPAVEASSGQTIIAFQVAEVQARLIAESRALAQEKLVERKLVQRLRGIREQGYLIAPSHDITGVTDICAPILDPSNRALAAIVVTCLQRVKKADRHDDIAGALVGTCRTISSSLQQAS